MPQTSYDQVLLSCSGGMRAGKAEEGGRGTGSERGGGGFANHINGSGFGHLSIFWVVPKKSTVLSRGSR